MSHLNVEIKARCADPTIIRQYLLDHALFKGVDDQTDTYFNVSHGRLKLREGNIENNLIWYMRPDDQGPKRSVFKLIPVTSPGEIKSLLIAANGLLVVVHKRREIYFIDNVKFHIDEVDGLGHFVEIEAGNMGYEIADQELSRQCELYIKIFGISEADMLRESYSDMLLHAAT